MRIVLIVLLSPLLSLLAGCASRAPDRDAYAEDYLYRCELRGGVQRLACLDLYRSIYPEHAARRMPRTRG